MAGVRKISTTCKKENDIVWNFTKFLVDREGNVVKRWSPITDPTEFRTDIEALL
jgi:glutathione peroxidase